MKLNIILLVFISTNLAVGQAYNCERVASKRTQITTDNIPNAYTCYMEMYRGNRGARFGTGFLIHPRVVLTAGHNIAWYPTGSVKKVNMYFGSIDSTTYLSKSNINLWKNKNKFYKSNYYVSGNIKRDYAIIILPDSSVYKKVKGHFKIQPIQKVTVDSLTITGSPKDKDNFEIWTQTSENYKQFNTYLKYDLYTLERNSGSPIWFKDGNDYNILGVHSRKYGSCGASVLITPDVYNQIIKWCSKAGIEL